MAFIASTRTECWMIYTGGSRQIEHSASFNDLIKTAYLLVEASARDSFENIIRDMMKSSFVVEVGEDLACRRSDFIIRV